jgi:MFS transporter, ACS family, tartrate transporter
MTTAVAADAAAKDDLFRRLVLRVVLPFALLTFVNAIDRTNVSFAAARMSADIGLTPTTFGFGVSAFFVAYLLFQFPHANLLRRFGIRPWVVGCLVLWGLSGLLMAQVTSVTGFVVARFLLGMAEAGFAPGATWYISRWTPPEARARALSIALAAVPA